VPSVRRNPCLGGSDILPLCVPTALHDLTLFFSLCSGLSGVLVSFFVGGAQIHVSLFTRFLRIRKKNSFTLIKAGFIFFLRRYFLVL